MRAGPRDMQKMLRVRFLGEDAIDAGGVQREWFELLAQEIFKAESCLFTQTSGGASVLSPTFSASLGGVTYDIVEHNLTSEDLKKADAAKGKENPDEANAAAESSETDAVAGPTATNTTSGGGAAVPSVPPRPAPQHPFQSEIDNFMTVTGVTDPESAVAYVFPVAHCIFCFGLWGQLAFLGVQEAKLM